MMATGPNACTCPVQKCTACGREFNSDDEGCMDMGLWYCDDCHPLGDGPGEIW